MCEQPQTTTNKLMPRKLLRDNGSLAMANYYEQWRFSHETHLKTERTTRSVLSHRGVGLDAARPMGEPS